MFGALVIVAAVIAWAAHRLTDAMAKGRRDETRAGALRLFEIFTPAIHAERDPRAIVIWEAHARRARAIFPAEFAALDRDGGGRFPFDKRQLQAAHSQWTAEWLAWEREHDASYKLKAAVLERELAGASDAVARSQIESLEREKLDLYQRRYQDYVTMAKALQTLVDSAL
jgi:hypothetical protein